MGVREKLRERVQPFLDAGEQIQSVFLAQTGPNPNLMFLTTLVLFWVRYDVVAVTDRRIVVLRASHMRPARPRRLIAEYPRQSRLGDASGVLFGRVELGGTKYWVHRRFRKDVRQADGALGSTVPGTEPRV